jgi:hypothetical protein
MDTRNYGKFHPRFAFGGPVGLDEGLLEKGLASYTGKRAPRLAPPTTPPAGTGPSEADVAPSSAEVGLR